MNMLNRALGKKSKENADPDLDGPITSSSSSTANPQARRGSIQIDDRMLITKLEPPENFTDYYSFDQKIYDAGDRSKVFVAKDLSRNGKEVIVKMRKKGFFTGGERVWRQMLARMMSLERNDNILGVQKIYEDPKAYYVVMQKCGGGELFDFLLNETDVSEKECKRIMREILIAVGHLHANGLVHRDLKPENMLFAGRRLSIDGVPQPEPQTEEERQKFAKQIKLIDFDTVTKYHKPKEVIDNDGTKKIFSPRAERTVGTPGYIAPESFRGDYTPSSDLWSVGVILYILMTGDMPFSENVFGDDLAGNNVVGGQKMEEVYKRLKNATIDFQCAPWPDFPEARSLCEKLLAFRPEDRYANAQDALQHPWLALAGEGSSEST